MRKIFFYIFLSLLPIWSLGSTLPVIDLRIGKNLIKAEVASTPSSQQLGLMYRKSMPDQNGMLFVFDQKASHCFWMRNTFLPLSIAFIDDDGKIVNIEDMKPQSEDNHCPLKPIRYALEMNIGWFEKRQIAAERSKSGGPKV
jgi:uncharacterized membrane protein (UPF0127 family)